MPVHLPSSRRSFFDVHGSPSLKLVATLHQSVSRAVVNLAPPLGVSDRREHDWFAGNSNSRMLISSAKLLHAICFCSRRALLVVAAVLVQLWNKRFDAMKQNASVSFVLTPTRMDICRCVNSMNSPGLLLMSASIIIIIIDRSDLIDFVRVNPTSLRSLVRRKSRLRGKI